MPIIFYWLLYLHGSACPCWFEQFAFEPERQSVLCYFASCLCRCSQRNSGSLCDIRCSFTLLAGQNLTNEWGNFELRRFVVCLPLLCSALLYPSSFQCTMLLTVDVNFTIDDYSQCLTSEKQWGVWHLEQYFLFD